MAKDSPMKIELDIAATDSHKIISYSNDCFRLRDKSVCGSLLISGKRLVENWFAGDYRALTTEDLDMVIEWRPEIILLGTGKRLHFPNRALLPYVVSRHIGFEIMDTGAACRSYNLLIDEGRDVAACLLPAGV